MRAVAGKAKDWADEERPADTGRRRFLQGTLIAGAAALVGTTIAGAKSLIPPPFEFRGTIENTFRYGVPESSSNWVLQKNLQFQVVHVTDFKLWDGASTLWREAFDEGGKAISGTGFPALIICVEASLLEVPTEFESYVVRRDVGGVPAVFIALYDRCVHLCCKPGWHYNVVPSTLHDYVTQPRTLLASPPQDPIWCQCHNSQYDPVTIVSDIHPPPANVPYIGARFVHGPATRALPCIPLKLNGTILEGIYDPGDGGHPEWYSAYC